MNETSNFKDLITIKKEKNSCILTTLANYKNSVKKYNILEYGQL